LLPPYSSGIGGKVSDARIASTTFGQFTLAIKKRTVSCRLLLLLQIAPHLFTPIAA
jgi:hypothetical protein